MPHPRIPSPAPRVPSPIALALAILTLVVPWYRDALGRLLDRAEGRA